MKSVFDTKIFLHKIPGLLLWEKDTTSTYVWANYEYISFFEFKKNHNIIGKNDYNIPHMMSELAPIFQKHDKKIIIDKTPLKFFEIVKSKNANYQIFLVTKIPKLDKDDIVRGTIGHAVDITSPFIVLGQFLSKRWSKRTTERLVQGSYAIGQKEYNYQNIKLTPRQSECLFFLLRNKTSKEIAKILELSHRTIESYIETIKIKFNCHTKSEIIDISEEYGFFNIIPEQIFKKQISIPLIE